MPYHPNYFEDGDNVVRQNCMERLERIRVFVKGGTLLDVGCSGGFYAFGLEQNCSGEIVAIDPSSSLVEECLRVKEKYRSQVQFRVQGLEEFLDTDNKVWDTILYLSVHHHLVEQEGQDKAEKLLTKLSSRGNQMFFDMGQKDEGNCEQHRWWQMFPDLGEVSEKDWIWLYLLTHTKYQRIDVIGSSPIHGTQRLLWRMS